MVSPNRIPVTPPVNTNLVAQIAEHTYLNLIHTSGSTLQVDISKSVPFADVSTQPTVTPLHTHLTTSTNIALSVLLAITTF